MPSSSIAAIKNGGSLSQFRRTQSLRFPRAMALPLGSELIGYILAINCLLNQLFGIYQPINCYSMNN